jgi:ABC-type multidrug transport system fused ATPase/permease subunit
MVKELYRRYRRQIAFAFILVILENAAYIAEPYVFGKAIDGLREARRIEEEVDSSVTEITLQQVADSVRAHVLDSMRTIDSLRGLDSLESYDESSTSSSGQNDRFDAGEEMTVTLASYTLPAGPADEDTIAESSHARPDSVKRILARKDSMRSKTLRKKPAAAREAARDSIRRQLRAHPPAPAHPADARTTNPPEPKKHVEFFVPREVGPFLPPLIPWVVLFVINSSLGAIRRVYDTRLYTKMFAQLSSEVVARQLGQGEELSKVAARSSMAWHNIEFFQYNVPEFLEQLIAVSGAVIALGLFDWRLTVVGGLLVLVVAAGSRFYMKVVQTYQVALHDKYEQEYNIFATRNPQNIRKYYSDISDLEIKLSDRGAMSYGVIRVLLLFMFMTTLYISVDLDRFTIGALYSIVAYVWSFVTATEYIPYLSEKWVTLKDTSRRIAIDLDEIDHESKHEATEGNEEEEEE